MRIRLPCKSGGLGIRRHTGMTAKASFMGMLIKTLPHMIDAIVTEGMALETRGFLNASLEALFGRGSFDESRISSRFSHLTIRWLGSSRYGRTFQMILSLSLAWWGNEPGYNNRPSFTSSGGSGDPDRPTKQRYYVRSDAARANTTH